LAFNGELSTLSLSDFESDKTCKPDRHRANFRPALPMFFGHDRVIVMLRLLALIFLLFLCPAAASEELLWTGNTYAAKFNYDAFGNIKTTDANNNPLANISGPRYGGQFHDANTDQIYLRNRYYDPKIGAFNRIDPIGFNGGLNLYGYCAGDGVNHWDPMGTELELAGELYGEGLVTMHDPLKQKIVDQMIRSKKRYSYASVEELDALLNNRENRQFLARDSGGALHKESKALNAAIFVAHSWSAPARVSAQVAEAAVIPGTKLTASELAILEREAAARTSKFVPRAVEALGMARNAAPKMQFGANANQVSHTFRHILEAGLDQGKVQAAIQADITANASAINSGLNIRTLLVDGKQITYNAFMLKDGLINIGRITLP
jgi:RHS repeat-associated protein